MTTRGGDNTKKAPKHKNSFAFKHNKNSKKTKKILGIDHHGLCSRCSEIIEWKKKYRKYKPLKAPKKCNGCDRRSIAKAYHTLCDDCARSRSVCAKCGKNPADDETGEGETTEEIIEKLEAGVPGMRERDRRAMLRKLYKGEGGDGEGEDRSGEEDAEDDEGGDAEGMDDGGAVAGLPAAGGAGGADVA
uniref:Uncharacterized protein n=1 Tax=Bicosoecida sp. CB-2014 TaxID=1486930 RepID=A0A6T6VFD4_9STRA|mmetsp:Transcript_15530/g.53935  ORF Transcript_15530/g.53935 Transcript_15530/m.53935 type:complete len:189 (+) Transcript_15530:392-958(+)